jgi:hypothetical protein
MLWSFVRDIALEAHNRESHALLHNNTTHALRYTTSSTFEQAHIMEQFYVQDASNSSNNAFSTMAILDGDIPSGYGASLIISRDERVYNCRRWLEFLRSFGLQSHTGNEHHFEYNKSYATLVNLATLKTHNRESHALLWPRCPEISSPA